MDSCRELYNENWIASVRPLCSGFAVNDLPNLARFLPGVSFVRAFRAVLPCTEFLP